MKLKSQASMEAKPALETFKLIHQTAVSIGEIAENWVFSADAERRYHFRPDGPQLDQMLTFLVENSLIFGDDE
ncbi:MAG: hypothetical protein JNK57_18365 [Planctomycetaceae bacterium]|jgi:hypothetical protein|nr:hypothetical protein [Planctomycetaceae bacterium]